MVEVNGVVVSFDVFKEKFLCDLEGCNGACCIEGDAGAPITPDEVKEVEALLPEIWEELLPEAREVIERQGISYYDPSGELVTSIVNGKDCVFTCYDEKGCCYCAIERAYRQGRVPFYKPISCHLYPIRVKQFRNGTYGLNYHRWAVCRDAVECGKKLGVPVYKALKEPIIRRFGEDFYKALECAEELLRQQ
jgi:hypothetical protein